MAAAVTACARHLTRCGSAARDLSEVQAVEALWCFATASSRCLNAEQVAVDPDAVYDVLTLLLSEIPLHIANLGAHLAPGAVGKRALKFRELLSFDTMYPVLHQATWSWQHARFATAVTTVAVSLARLGLYHAGAVDSLAHHAARHLWVFSPLQLAVVLDALVRLGCVVPAPGGGPAPAESSAVATFVDGAVRVLRGAGCLPPGLHSAVASIVNCDKG